MRTGRALRTGMLGEICPTQRNLKRNPAPMRHKLSEEEAFGHPGRPWRTCVRFLLFLGGDVEIDGFGQTWDSCWMGGRGSLHPDGSVGAPRIRFAMVLKFLFCGPAVSGLKYPGAHPSRSRRRIRCARNFSEKTSASLDLRTPAQRPAKCWR